MLPHELARLHLAHERLAVGGGTLLAFLLLWEAFGESGLVDPLFISSPTRVAQAGWQLVQDRDAGGDVVHQNRLGHFETEPFGCQPRQRKCCHHVSRQLRIAQLMGAEVDRNHGKVAARGCFPGRGLPAGLQQDLPAEQDDQAVVLGDCTITTTYW